MTMGGSSGGQPAVRSSSPRHAATPMAGLHVFRDRREAGRELAAAVRDRAFPDPVVLGLPRGGVPVAYEVARALAAPLDVVVARKIGAPGNPELAIGAVAEAGVEVLDEMSVRRLMVSHEELEHAIDGARAELRERAARYRRGREPADVTGRTAIVVDDGLATGATARAAVRAVRFRSPGSVVLAVPVGAPDSLAALRDEVDDLVCVQQPKWLRAVGYWYEQFGQTPDAEVVELLRRAGDGGAASDPPPQAPDPPRTRAVDIEIAGLARPLRGDLVVPGDASGIVVFAHGSGSSRHSPRNRHVAETMNRAGLATLLLDLLTPDEELDRRNVFDVGLLARRLTTATRWIAEQPEIAALPVACFGASTGAGAALWAAAEAPAGIRAVVSRGGRPDLAAGRLRQVSAPTLLIVGGRDRIVLELNRRALELLGGPAELVVVPGATHLFEEPGALDAVADLAIRWFARHLAVANAPEH